MRIGAKAYYLFFIVVALSGAGAVGAVAQENQKVLPTINVTSSRLGDGIVGASSSIITAEEIARSTALTLPEILAEQPGVQIQHLFGGTNGSRDSVDMRGFGASAASNVLVLVNGRRFNDFDLQGFDFSAIPLNSIERIEITRGGAGSVLYGDGAVGGTINIVTKSGENLPSQVRVDTALGSFHQQEGRFSANTSANGFSAAINGTSVTSGGYRLNNQLRQNAVVGDFRKAIDGGSIYLNVTADTQRLGLPGGRHVTLTSSELETDRTGTSTPFDYGNKQGVNVAGGMTRMLAPGAELILDASLRRKYQRSGFFFDSNYFSYIRSGIITMGITPRLKLDTDMFGLPSKILTGIDYYRTSYSSDRYLEPDVPPFRHYNINQTTTAAYWQQTVSVRPNTDVSAGVRLQRDSISARDTYDPNAPGGFGDAQGIPLDKSDWQYAVHLGFDHRFNDNISAFGRLGRAFRVPNADERVGQAASFNFPVATATNFDLRTQTSEDVEGGVKLRWGRFNLQSSVYYMNLRDEVFFSIATGTNINLDPTKRYGWENAATYQVNDKLKLKGGITYTRAQFRDGLFAGNDVPLVSRWTANAGASWDLWEKLLVYDVMLRYMGNRRFDNDAANFQPMIPQHTVVDMRLGGENKNFYWSLAVQNVFNLMYYDYGIASGASSFGPAVFGTFNAYPQPGRTFLARFGVKFGG